MTNKDVLPNALSVYLDDHLVGTLHRADPISFAYADTCGAQFKMLLSLDERGMPLRPMGMSPSTHILKPDIVRSDINIFASAINETIVMRAASLCELPTARVDYQPTTRACLVEPGLIQFGFK